MLIFLSTPTKWKGQTFSVHAEKSLVSTEASAVWQKPFTYKKSDSQMTFSCIENFGLRANIITQNVCSSAVARSLDCHLRPWCPAVVYPATQLCNIALAWSSEKILHHLYKAVTFLKCSTDQRMMPHKIINSMFPPMPNLQIHLVISVFFLLL